MIRNTSAYTIAFLRMLVLSERIALLELEEGDNIFFSSLIEFSQMQRRMIIRKYSRNTRKMLTSYSVMEKYDF